MRLASLPVALWTVVVLLAGPVVDVQAQQAGADSAQTAPTESAVYTVEDGDTLYSIARRFGVSVRALMEWNGMETPALQIGQSLRIRPPTEESEHSPEESPPPVADSEIEPGELREQGEPRTQVADREPPADANAARTDTTGTVTTGTDTTGTDTAGEASTTAGGLHATVARAGDTLIDIALRYGTTADTLFALNDSLQTALVNDQTVLLPPRFSGPVHVVQSGETLYGIAGTYGVSVRAIQQANELEVASIQPGQRLRIPGRRGARTPPPPDTTGRVALYPPAFAGRLTASGSTYDPSAFVGSHPTLPYGSVVLLSDPETRSHCFVEIIDRGPVEDDLIMDVSGAVAQQLSLDPQSETPLQLRVVWVERSGG
jgi:LysM repeat protein